MIAARHCSKPGCSRPAVATLTYDYSNSTVVLGPLASVAEPHAYDMCEEHANHLTAPQGWQVVRLQTQFEPAPPSPDDLMALADAVREAARRSVAPPQGSRRRISESSSPLDSAPAYVRRRSNFHVVTGLEKSAGQERGDSGPSGVRRDNATAGGSHVATQSDPLTPEFGPFTPKK